MMADCRFCGARLEAASPDFDCPLCGRHNAADRAPARMEWTGAGLAQAFAHTRLPFASVIRVADGQRALLRMDGQTTVLGPGEHTLYPVAAEAADLTYVSDGWHSAEDILERTLLLPDAVWQLRVAWALETRVTDPASLADSGAFSEDVAQRLDGWLRSAAAALADEALAALSPSPSGGRDALAARIDAILAGLDDEALNRKLAEAGKGFLSARALVLRRTLLAMEDEDGEPCPACGRRNPRAEGRHVDCAFCGKRLYWCPNCHSHVLRRDERWCPNCRARIYA